jgi:hypothetical protein
VSCAWMTAHPSVSFSNSRFGVEFRWRDSRPIPDTKRGRLTEEALSAAGALWSPSTERYFEAMVGFTQPFFITPCDGRRLR